MGVLLRKHAERPRCSVVQAYMCILHEGHWVLGALHRFGNEVEIGIWDPCKGWSAETPQDCCLGGCMFKHGVVAIGLEKDTMCRPLSEPPQPPLPAYRQGDGSSCGIYVLMMALYLMSHAASSHAELSFTGDAAAAREFWATSIAHGRLLLPPPAPAQQAVPDQEPESYVFNLPTLPPINTQPFY